MGKIVPFSTKHFENFKQDLKSLIAEKNFNSIEEANAFLQKFSEKRNASGLADFLGLSPNQMRVILYRPLQIGKFIQIDKSKLEYFVQIPIIVQAYYLLDKILQAQKLKLTEKGNLPRALVKEFWLHFIKNEKYFFEPHREEDCLELTRLKCLLLSSRLLQKRSKDIILTKKGEKILKEKDSGSLYMLLFESCFNDWNWAYMDRYAENEMIQMAGQFSLLLLKQRAHEWTTVEELGKEFIKTFPMSVNQADLFWDSPEEGFINCFSARFLDRVCVPFGLIEWEFSDTFFSKLTDRFKTTEFLKKVFSFDKDFNS